ncbi:MAG: hypothetical protein MUF22_06400 [Chitinispirillaceae bacterium]|jgi:hypothetical protein|nr:hypothetical protein [Chitinispirillaceae bacterium]
MASTIILVVILGALILIAIRMISTKRSPDEENSGNDSGPLIHASGIYSIVRKSPREDLLRIRPPESEIQKYLSSINEDSDGQPLSPADKALLLEQWRRFMGENISIVEKGDAAGVEFYYYDFPEKQGCRYCNAHFNQGQFVSRQEIYKYPRIIPPFHLGCSTMLVAYQGKENLRDTTIIGMTPFFENNSVPPLPEWTKTIKP